VRRTIPMGGIRMWPEGACVFSAWARFRPLLSALRAAYFLLLRQKKVSKEKATPAYAVGFADSPALLATGGRCGTRAFGPQTVLALFPPASALLGAADGDPKGVPGTGIVRQYECSCWPLKNSNIRHHRLNPDVFPGPLRGAEQRRNAGGLRLALSEPKASSGKPPGVSSSTGNPRSAAGTDPGVTFSLATFFWANKRKYARPQGGKQRLLSETNVGIV